MCLKLKMFILSLHMQIQLEKMNHTLHTLHHTLHYTLHLKQTIFQCKNSELRHVTHVTPFYLKKYIYISFYKNWRNVCNVSDLVENIW